MDFIHKTLLKIGVPANIIGFRALHDGIRIEMDKPNSIDRMTKTIYPEVAKLQNTTPSKVERAMRHAVDVAFEKGNIEVLHEYSGGSIDPEKGKPTNSQFIAVMALILSDATEAAHES